ncbi:PilC/PilY family type IV pilus protein [Variovorax sp. J31P207]|uniref:pilus assembly protein n=1 Tax=Variovorax sp. J31P207 TaxID=3053510 RepID=UPI002575C533|nr:PilC/PilY family type IV pilus protein [Variovorax sp. J31P207]MDM0068018.1 PilC/PilY family type IV pilus protein [Variovorax sp. J31P207]
MNLLSAIVSTGWGSVAALAEPLPLSTAPVDIAALSSLVASSGSSRLDAALFVAAYDARGWSGSITGYRIRATTAALDTAGLWGTANLMDARDDRWPATRLVLSARTEDGATTGISWKWPALSLAQQQALMTVDGVLDTAPDAAERAKERLDHIRGDRTREQSATPPGPLRARPSRQGDIVNSKLWLLAGPPSSPHAAENHAAFRAASRLRPSMLYVGGNDGLLHGFDAVSGEEKIAYLPEGLHPRIGSLTQPGYQHAYFVDGSPLGGDLYLGPPGSRDARQWRTYLAGFLGAGGRGYFVLDVTDPSTFDAVNAAALVVLDRTRTAGLDRDIGHLTSAPVIEAGDPALSRQIARMNNGRWALVMGNGYNSADERAVLLIQYLDEGRELFKIAAEGDKVAGRGNGLSAPRLIDLDGNGTPDLAYAGDLHGNLWKFDLGAVSPGQWEVAFGGVPLFIATRPGSVVSRQPITTAPVWKAHPDGGVMLAFGTGRELTVADRVDSQVQTVYGVRDDSAVSGVRTQGQGPIYTGRAALVAQSMRTGAGRGPGTVSSNPVPYSGSQARRGWFLDLPVARERVLQHPSWFEGDLIDIWSIVPANADGTKTSPARHFRTTIDIVNGAAPKSPLYVDVPAATAGQPSRIETGPGVGIRGAQQEIGVSAPGVQAPPARHRLGTFIRRPSWRQMQ